MVTKTNTSVATVLFAALLGAMVSAAFGGYIIMICFGILDFLPNISFYEGLLVYVILSVAHPNHASAQS